MPRPICVPCGRFMRAEKNGFIVLEKDGEGNPYKIWSGDKYKCHSCGHEAVTGFSQRCVDHFDPSFASYENEINLEVTS